MNDFDYDCMQKKRIARGAFSRKGTVNRKGCRLPHENLTKKELEAMNGEVKTVGFNDKITWEFFKKLPTDLQEEYLQYQLDRFSVGVATVGHDLFGLAKHSLCQYNKDHGIHVTSRGKGMLSSEVKTKWERWLNGEDKIAPINETADVPQVTMCEEDFLPSAGTSNKTVEPRTPTSEEDFLPNTETVNKIAATKPFRAHDFEELFRDCGMERGATSTLVKEKEDSENVNLYPLKDLSMTLKGTPVDILATLQQSFPALLDKDRQYRFTIKVDDYVV